MASTYLSDTDRARYLRVLGYILLRINVGHCIIKCHHDNSNYGYLSTHTDGLYLVRWQHILHV